MNLVRGRQRGRPTAERVLQAAAFPASALHGPPAAGHSTGPAGIPAWGTRRPGALRGKRLARGTLRALETRLGLHAGLRGPWTRVCLGNGPLAKCPSAEARAGAGDWPAGRGSANPTPGSLPSETLVSGPMAPPHRSPGAPRPTPWHAGIHICCPYAPRHFFAHIDPACTSTSMQAHMELLHKTHRHTLASVPIALCTWPYCGEQEFCPVRVRSGPNLDGCER